MEELKQIYEIYEDVKGRIKRDEKCKTAAALLAWQSRENGSKHLNYSEQRRWEREQDRVKWRNE